MQDQNAVPWWRKLSMFLIAEFLLNCANGTTTDRIIRFSRQSVDHLLYNPLGIVDDVNWSDFFEKFKFPDNLYDRISSNLAYYSRGYFRLAFFATLFISAGKGEWLIRATFCQYIVSLIPLAESMNPADAEYFRLLGLCFTQILVWSSFIRELLYPPTTLFAAALIVAHASFRTRSWTRTVSDFFRKKQN